MQNLHTETKTQQEMMIKMKIKKCFILMDTVWIMRDQFSKPKLAQYSRTAQVDNDVEAAVQFHVAGI